MCYLCCAIAGIIYYLTKRRRQRSAGADAAAAAAQAEAAAAAAGDTTDPAGNAEGGDKSNAANADPKAPLM